MTKNRNKVADPYEYMDQYNQNVTRGFATMAHPFILVIVNNDYQSDEYLMLTELIDVNKSYDSMALTSADHLIIYCADQQSRTLLREAAQELGLDARDFV